MGSWEWDLVTGRICWDDGQYRIYGVEPEIFSPTRPQSLASSTPTTVRRMQAVRRRPPPPAQATTSSSGSCGPGGELRWCMAGGARDARRRRHPVRLNGVTYDITERKRAEDALQAAQRGTGARIEERTRERETALAQLFEAQKMDTIGQLTGGVAHDFNNLLMAVLGSLELLKKRLPAGRRALARGCSTMP